MRTILIVTVSRSDWGIYLPVVQRLQQTPAVRLLIAAGGMHHAREYGRTIDEVRQQVPAPIVEVEFLLASDSPAAIAKSLGLGVISFAQVYSEYKPDIIIVLGDRYEMYAAALAALPYYIPVAHIHGGELSLGAMDDAIRHSITKLSHLHFVATEQYGRRVVQLGEEPWRVIVSGAPALDRIAQFRPMLREEFLRIVGLPDLGDFLLVTFHPVTSEYELTEWQIGELLRALEIISMPVVFTSPNADTNSHIIQGRIIAFCQTHTFAHYVAHMGTALYYNAMYHAAAMVGNSSSGIIEAPSFGLPVVNIGTRQEGRLRGRNVLDVGYHHQDIVAGIHQALDVGFRQSLKTITNPYGDGHASDRIAHVLSTIPLDERLLKKRFFDLDTKCIPLSSEPPYKEIPAAA
jgi:UDP-N-acetylglucosamine 2-epimerase (non-hydrolysing)/GDP/UDP-N,N'-diacetylbacillosamine 2-epimerase (hydrolysing)